MSMPSKEMTAEQVVARIEDGMTVGIGGWGSRRKPMALVREILRSNGKLTPEVSHLLWFIEGQQEGRHGRGREARRAA